MKQQTRSHTRVTINGKPPAAAKWLGHLGLTYGRTCRSFLMCRPGLRGDMSPDWCDSVGCHPAKQKVTSSIPSQSMCLGCGFVPGQDAYERQPIDVSFSHLFDVSLPLFLTLFPSLEIKSLKKKQTKLEHQNLEAFSSVEYWVFHSRVPFIWLVLRGCLLLSPCRFYESFSTS